MPEPSPAPKHDPYAAFRHRDYVLYTIGSVVALICTRIQAVAIGWDIYDRTNDALALGIVGAVQAVPMLLLALPAGDLADRYNRRNIMLLGMIGTSITSLMLAYVSWIEGSIQLMYGLLLLDSVALTIARPARMAMLPQIVPKDVFPNAVTWRTSVFQVSSVVGPAIGGFVVAWHVPIAYVISATGTMIFFCLILTMRYRGVRGGAVRPDSDKQTGSFGRLLEGIGFLNNNRLLLTIISLDMFAVLLGGAVYLLPIFARDILRVGEVGFGFLNAAPAAGAVLTALTVAHLPPMKNAGRNLLFAVAGFGAATIVFGFSTSFWLSLAMLFLTGVFDNVSVVIRHTLVQVLTPDHMRGRVSAVNSVFIGTSNELGGFESGLVARLFTPVVSVVSGGIGTIVVVCITALASKRLRELGSLEDAHPPALEDAFCESCGYNLRANESGLCPECGEPVEAA